MVNARQHTDASVRSSGRSFRHRFEGPFFRNLMLAGIRCIPRSLQRASLPMWAGIFYAALPEARRAVEGNLRRVLGPASALLERQRSFRLFLNYAQSLTDMYGMYLGREVPVEVRFVGREHVYRVIESGRGAIAFTGHLGAWQVTPFVIGRSGDLPPLTMAMATEPHQGAHLFESQLRARFRVVYTTSSAFALIELANCLRRGEVVGMQLDRNVGGPQVELPLFGAPAPFPLALATLARTTGCPLVPVFAVYRDERRCIEVHYEPPIEVPHTRDRAADLGLATRRAVQVYEEFVRRFPEQWFNFFDVWRATPEARRG
jgi:KDO2-lipid IV(A) lauroyltransferase